jgi:hypothetical protein
MLVFAELLLRSIPLMDDAFKHHQLKKEFLAATKTHPVWGWSFVPNVDTTWNFSNEEETISVSLKTRSIPNYPRFGMRDDGLDRGKDLVVVLGDSFSFGATVELEDIWTERIEREHTNLDMLNIANGGGIAKAVAQYQELKAHLPYHKHVIYQMWLGNEFLDNWAWSKAGSFTETENNLGQELLGQKLKRKSKLYLVSSFAFERLRFYLGYAKNVVRREYLPENTGVYREKWGYFAVKPNNLIWTRYCEKDYLDAKLIEGVRKTAEALRKFQQLVGDKGIVVIFPFKHQVHFDVIDDLVAEYQWELLKPNKLVLDMCHRYGIRCWDITQELRKNRAEKLYWDYDPHFTPLGHYYAAEAISTFLKGLDVH